MVDLEYLSLNRFQRFFYRINKFFVNIPKSFCRFFKSIPAFFKKVFNKIGESCGVVVDAMRYGDWKTRLSYLFFGFGNIANGQILRGLLLFVYEVAFILYMAFFGAEYISKFGTIGSVKTETLPSGFTKVGDNSFNILLFSCATFVIILCTLFVWFQSIKQAYTTQQMVQINAKLAKGRDDIKNLGNKYYHATLLSVPTILLTIFTVIPLIFMVFVAFTNYNNQHLPPKELFTWVGFDNFTAVLAGKGIGTDAVKFSYTFWVVLLWTLIWAVLATFSNFFIGMFLAILINKKGIKLKKFWRTALVVTIAVPQFVSLLLMSQMLMYNSIDGGGIYNSILQLVGLEPVYWLGDTWMAKVSVVLVNLWVGVPYTVLSSTGILLNIPDDLYEAARIDGANPYAMFAKITFPYMTFVLGPSLISTFVGNINNFNIIYLLTGGGPNLDTSMATTAGQTDLLITWLYKMTVNNQQYDIASVIGILVFIVCAVFSLIAYSRIGSVKNEEDFR